MKPHEIARTHALVDRQRQTIKSLRHRLKVARGQERDKQSMIDFLSQYTCYDCNPPTDGQRPPQVGLKDLT